MTQMLKWRERELMIYLLKGHTDRKTSHINLIRTINYQMWKLFAGWSRRQVSLTDWMGGHGSATEFEELL